MSQQNKPADAIDEFKAEPYPTELVTLVSSVVYAGVSLVSFYLIKKGDPNPYKGAIVEIVDGPDAGKRFVANIAKFPRGGEPLMISILSEVKPE